MNKELNRINKKIAFWSETRPENLNREEYNKKMAELFDEKRRILADQPTDPIDRLQK